MLRFHIGESTYEINNAAFICEGIMFTFTIVIISYILAKFPILHTIGALAIAIIFAMIYRQVIGYPEHIRPGITFASKRLLKFAIILYGLKLNIGIF